MGQRTRSGLVASARVLASLLVLLSAACRSATVAAETLPFHVALVPFELTRVPSGAGDELLEFDGGELAREFGALLDGLTFTAISVLAPPDGVTPEEFAAWPRERRERHWIESASASRADLLLLGALEFDPWVQTTVVGGSLSFGLIDGLLKAVAYANLTTVSAILSVGFSVSAWRGQQRRHAVHVGFDGSLLDLGPLLDRSSEADLVNRRTQLVHSWKFESDLTSTFSDREGWLGHLLSVFLPGAFFPNKRSVLAASLRERVAEGIFAGMVEELEFRKRELLHGDDPFPFRVEHLGLERQGASSVLSVGIVLTSETMDAMDGYRVWIDGEQAADAGFRAAVRGQGAPRYDLRVPLGSVPPSAAIRLELRDASPRQNIRTFTLRLGRTGRRAEKMLAVQLTPSAKR